MIVAVNGFVINDPTNPNQVYLDTPFDGLGIPPIRTSSGSFSGIPGGYVSKQIPDMRLISMTGRVFSASPAALATTRRAFIAALMSSSNVVVTITADDGGQYLINANLDDFDLPVNATIRQTTWTLSLIAGDPVIYDNSATGLMTATVHLAQGGGITWPISWNPVTWAAGSLPTVVTNTGLVVIYPVITLYGQMTNPVITNTTTGAFFSLNGLTTGATDVVVIDMKNRTVLLNGGSILVFKTTTSTWWSLTTGSNSINLTSSNSSDTVVATITWRSGYWGI